jgi:uncharacterized protein (DUF427 family)
VIQGNALLEENSSSSTMVSGRQPEPRPRLSVTVLTERPKSNSFSLGIGLIAPPGLPTRWENTYTNRHGATRERNQREVSKIGVWIEGQEIMTIITKAIKTPGPAHPITIEPSGKRVTVTVAGKVIADTRDALTLREAAYPVVFYVPRKDVDMEALERTEHSTYCPYKGDCAYFSIPAGGARAVNAVWTYEAPFDAVVSIKDHLAFYTDRVDSLLQHLTKHPHLEMDLVSG